MLGTLIATAMTVPFCSSQSLESSNQETQSPLSYGCGALHQTVSGQYWDGGPNIPKSCDPHSYRVYRTQPVEVEDLSVIKRIFLVIHWTIKSIALSCNRSCSCKFFREQIFISGHSQ